MPYYLYQINQSTHQLIKDLNLLEQFDSFRPAKRKAREHRALPENAKHEYKNYICRKSARGRRTATGKTRNTGTDGVGEIACILIDINR